jgi:hypothetical protein
MAPITNIRFGEAADAYMVAAPSSRSGQDVRIIDPGIDRMTMQSASGSTPMASAWRTPVVILVCGCLISAINFGPRAALGLFLTPMTSANSWSREVFSLRSK